MLKIPIVVVFALAVTSACGRESAPAAPGSVLLPVVLPFAATYAGQFRIDSCAGCSPSNVGKVKAFELRLAETTGSGVSGTLNYDYGATVKLIDVSGDRGADGTFRLTGVVTPASALDPVTPFELRSLLVREAADGSLSGAGEYVSGSFASATYQISVVSGSQVAGGTASVGIDGTWIGHALVLDCQGDKYVCGTTMGPGKVRPIEFRFSSAGGTVDGLWIDPPSVMATVPVRGVFTGQVLSLGADLEVIEIYRGDTSPRDTELARVRFTLPSFTMSIDAFNRLQGDLTYSVVRTRTFSNASFGRVETGTVTLRLSDVVPALEAP